MQSKLKLVRLFLLGAVLGGLLMVGISFAQEPVPEPTPMVDEYGEPVDLPVVKLAERFWQPLMEQLTQIQTACQVGGGTGGAVGGVPTTKPHWKPKKEKPEKGLRGGGGGKGGRLQPVQPAPAPVPVQ